MSYKEKDFVYRMILKENETLKKALKEKGMLPDTTQSMLSILDLQRDRIFVLEEGLIQII